MCVALQTQHRYAHGVLVAALPAASRALLVPVVLVSAVLATLLLPHRFGSVAN